MGATESKSGPVPFTVVLCPILTLQFSDPTPPRRASKSSFRAGDVPWINSVPPSVPSSKIQNFFRNLFGKLWTRYSYRILLGSIKELKIGISWLRFSHELHLESTVDSDRKRCCDHKEIHGSRESLPWFLSCRCLCGHVVWDAWAFREFPVLFWFLFHEPPSYPGSPPWKWHVFHVVKNKTQQDNTSQTEKFLSSTQWSFKNQIHTHTRLTTFPSFPSTLCSSRPATQTPEVFFGRQTPNIYFPSLIENRQETLFSFAFSASLGLFFLFPLVTGAELDPCPVPGSGPGFQLMSHTGLASVPCWWAVNMVVCRRWFKFPFLKIPFSLSIFSQGWTT